MLERFTESHGKKARRRLGPAALLSIVAHVGGLAVLLGMAAWQVDKLDTIEPPIVLAVGASAFLADPEEDQGEKKEEEKKQEEKKRPTKTKVLALAEKIEPQEEDSDGEGEKAEGEETDGKGGPGYGAACPPGAECPAADPPQVLLPECGNHQVEAGEECDDGGRVAGDGCSASCRTERVTVPARLIEGQRIAGDPQIAPPESVRTMMARTGQTRVTGHIRMCLGRDGNVRSLRVQQSTGYPAYDHLLTSRMREWRYRPYQLASGNAVPVCTTVIFIFQLR